MSWRSGRSGIARGLKATLLEGDHFDVFIRRITSITGRECDQRVRIDQSAKVGRSGPAERSNRGRIRWLGRLQDGRLVCWPIAAVRKVARQPRRDRAMLGYR